MTKSRPAEVFEYTPDEEAKLEHMVDTGEFTYDDARRHMGIRAVRTDFSASSLDVSTPGDHKPANMKAAMRLQYGDNGGIETPDGVPHYYSQFVPLSEEQIATNARGRKKVTEALRDAKIDHLMDTMGISYDEAAQKID